MFRGPWILAAGAWTSLGIAHPALHVEVLQLGTCSWVGGSSSSLRNKKKQVVSSKCFSCQASNAGGNCFIRHVEKCKVYLASSEQDGHPSPSS